MADDLASRDFAAPRRTGQYNGLVLDYLDPDDHDDRRVLIEADHPEYREALEGGGDVVDSTGTTVSPRMHITLHEVVASQLLADDPPEMWQTAQRLISLDYKRHEVLHMLASVVSDELFATMHGDALEPSVRRRKLAALPQSWERLRGDEQPVLYRASRRARGRHRR